MYCPQYYMNFYPVCFTNSYQVHLIHDEITMMVSPMFNSWYGVREYVRRLRNFQDTYNFRVIEYTNNYMGNNIQMGLSNVYYDINDHRFDNNPESNVDGDYSTSSYSTNVNINTNTSTIVFTYR